MMLLFVFISASPTAALTQELSMSATAKGFHKPGAIDNSVNQAIAKAGYPINISEITLDSCNSQKINGTVGWECSTTIKYTKTEYTFDKPKQYATTVHGTTPSNKSNIDEETSIKQASDINKTQADEFLQLYSKKHIKTTSLKCSKSAKCDEAIKEIHTENESCYMVNKYLDVNVYICMSVVFYEPKK
jgi:hypothetical protein